MRRGRNTAALKALAAMAAAALLFVLASSAPALAQTTTARVDSNARVPLVVNQSVDTGFPKDLPVGTSVCAQGEYTYVGDTSRYRFQAWRVGAADFKALCVTLVGGQTHTALFQEEALVQVTSVLPQVASFQWAAVGSVIELSAPDTVSGGDDKRWRFTGWSAGLSPFSTATQLVVTRAIAVEARYATEYRIQVTAPEGATAGGAGWYTSGQMATIRTDDVVSQGEGKRLRFTAWEAEGLATGALAQPSLPVVSFTVAAPATFRPRYTQEYMVTASGPQGVLAQGWQEAGKIMTVETPSALEGLKFVKWREAGAADSLSLTSKLQLAVSRPMKLEAVYEASTTPGTPTTPGTAILNSNASTVPLLVDGVEIKQAPATVPAGSRACVPASVTYTTEGERYRFVGWSDSSTELCRVLTGGTTVAFFERQMLLRITSSVASVEEIRWVPANTVVDLDAPALIEEDNTRWTFQSWSAGEQPTSRSTHLAILKPQDIEAKFTPSYLVQLSPIEGVTLAGGGWYKPGDPAVLRAPAHVEQTVDTRLSFVQWDQVGDKLSALTGLDKAELTLAVNAPVVLQPRYAQEFLVEAENPQGVITRSWAEKGTTLDLETPAIVDVIEGEERLRFTHWQEKASQDPPLAQMPKLVLPVTRPIALEAVYRREFKLTLTAPYGGSGTGWYAENSTAILSVPPQPQAVLFLKKVFQGYAGYPDTGPVLQLVVQGPMQIGAVYKNEVDFKILLFVVGGILLAFLIWRLTEMRSGAAKAAEAQAGAQGAAQQPPVEEEIIEEYIEEEDDASRPPISTSARPRGGSSPADDDQSR